MLENYVAIIAPVAAILNGCIAVIVANFFKERPGAKWALVIAALVLGAAAIAGTVYSQSAIVAAKNADAALSAAKRTAFAELLTSGDDLLNRCGDTKTAPPPSEIFAWHTSANEVLIQYGAHYISRFHNMVGVPSTFVLPNNPCGSKAVFDLYGRVYRLNEFIDELGPQ